MSRITLVMSDLHLSDERGVLNGFGDEQDDEHIPLRDVTRLVFVLVNSMPDGSSSASLCAWEGGFQG